MSSYKGTAKSGIGVTKHSVEHKINRGVRSADEMDDLKNPLKKGPVKIDQLGRPSQRFVGEKAEVAINPETGKIVSVNPTSTKKAQRLNKHPFKKKFSAALQGFYEFVINEKGSAQEFALKTRDNSPQKDVTRKIVEKRIRNRMIEYWELTSSFRAQENYQGGVPGVFVPNEIINQWEDWQPFENPTGHYHAPVFSDEEVTAIEEFHHLWSDVISATSDPLPALDHLENDPNWKRLMSGAGKAYHIFSKRGKMDEENEIVE